MDFNAILVLVALWFVVNLLSNLRRKGNPPPRIPSREPSGAPRPPLRIDATQREGQRLELVLRELQRSLEAAGPAGRTAKVSLPEAEEVEDVASLEVDPETRSLETEVRRANRQVVDLDEEAEQVEARRIAAAAARGAARTKSDHAEFDQRIRQEPADHTATRGYTAKQLRDAVVWREILGPPASLREEA